MCIFVLALDQSDEFPVVLFFNRDEEYDRDTKPCAEEPSTGIVCARDGKANGTWMGLAPGQGTFAALTNVRNRLPPPACTIRSRGELVLGALLGNKQQALAAHGRQHICQYTSFYRSSL